MKDSFFSTFQLTTGSSSRDSGLSLLSESNGTINLEGHQDPLLAGFGPGLEGLEGIRGIPGLDLGAGGMFGGGLMSSGGIPGLPNMADPMGNMAGLGGGYMPGLGGAGPGYIPGLGGGGGDGDVGAGPEAAGLYTSSSLSSAMAGLSGGAGGMPPGIPMSGAPGSYGSLPMSTGSFGGMPGLPMPGGIPAMSGGPAGIPGASLTAGQGGFGAGASLSQGLPPGNSFMQPSYANYNFMQPSYGSSYMSEMVRIVPKFIWVLLEVKMICIKHYTYLYTSIQSKRFGYGCSNFHMQFAQSQLVSITNLVGALC